MVQGDSSTVSANAIDKMVMNIFDYATKNNTIINDMKQLVSESNAYYKSEDGEAFRRNFEEITSKSQQLNANILSFASDLTKIKNEYYKTNLKVASIFEESMAEISKKIDER